MEKKGLGGKNLSLNTKNPKRSTRENHEGKTIPPGGKGTLFLTGGSPPLEKKRVLFISPRPGEEGMLPLAGGPLLLGERKICRPPWRRSRRSGVGGCSAGLSRVEGRVGKKGALRGGCSCKKESGKGELLEGLQEHVE